MQNPQALRQEAVRKFVVDEFDQKAIFLCQFCGGAQCKHEDYKANKKLPNAIEGLNSNWITDKILAMQRPSERLIKEYNLYQKFKENGIRAILNLQQPGEHPYCGDGIIKNVGFSYIPQNFYKHGIHCFSQSWQDMTSTTFEHMMRIMNIFESTLRDNGKISVHCHAGRGRTLLVICSWLIYNDRIPVKDVIKLAQERREGVLASQNQHEFLRYFQNELHQRWISYHIDIAHRSYGQFIQWQTLAFLKKDKNKMMSTAAVHYKLLKQLRKMSKQDPMSVLQAFLTPYSQYFKIPWDAASQEKLSKLKTEINNKHFKKLGQQKDPRILTQLLFDFYDTLPFTLMTAISIDCLRDQFEQAEEGCPKLKIILSPSIVHNIGVQAIATIFDLAHLFRAIIRREKKQEEKVEKQIAEENAENKIKDNQVEDSTQSIEYALYMRLALMLLCKRKFFPKIFRGQRQRQCRVFKLGPKIMKVVGTQSPFLCTFLRDLSTLLPEEHSELESIIFKLRKVQSNLFYLLKEGKHGYSLSGQTKNTVYNSARVKH